MPINLAVVSKWAGLSAPGFNGFDQSGAIVFLIGNHGSGRNGRRLVRNLALSQPSVYPASERSFDHHRLFESACRILVVPAHVLVLIFGEAPLGPIYLLVLSAGVVFSDEIGRIRQRRAFFVQVVERGMAPSILAIIKE